MKSCFMFGHADCPDSMLPKRERKRAFTLKMWQAIKMNQGRGGFLCPDFDVFREDKQIDFCLFLRYDESIFILKERWLC